LLQASTTSDIDASTLVDLAAPTPDGEQAKNYRVSCLLMGYIRSHEPAGTTISVGAEIGHIGGRNSQQLLRNMLCAVARS
jgi:hypothetical protein